MKVGVIGHRNIEKSPELVKRLNDVITELVLNENADTFYFGIKNEFNDLCYEVVTDIRYQYPYIQRVFAVSEYDYGGGDYLRYSLIYYEDAYFPYKVPGSGILSNVKRNQVIVDMSDVLIVYYDLNYQPSRRSSSGTKRAIDYAKRKKKRIINVFQ